MLEVRAVDFDYGDQPLLCQVGLTIPSGMAVHLRGSNGVGKTTLLRLITGLLLPKAGDIFFYGQSIYNDLTSYHHNLCYIGHKTGASQLLTVSENIRFDLHHRRSPLSMNELLKCFSLEGLQDTLFSQLSQGQQRRVGLLRFFMTNARFWVLDEPLIGLDAKSMAQLIDLFHQHLERGGSILLTSHQPLPFRKEFYQEYSL